ncbi:MAG: SH3 domain-containing protein [Caulobacterales bacterium]
MRDVYIVTAERLRLRDEPAATGRILRYLMRGETVHVLETAPGDEWWKIRLRGAITGAATGWAASHWLRERNPKPRLMQPDEIREKLKAFCPKGGQSLMDSIAEPLSQQLPDAAIQTPLRLQHFFAQSAYETDHYTSFLEGHSRLPDDYFRQHCDPGTPLGAALGNTEKDDGPRYKGRGMLMLAGRANYAAAAEGLGLDLINHPELAERPENAVKTALWIWKMRGMAIQADEDSLENVTRALAGDQFDQVENTLDRRRALLDAARKIWR